MRGAPLFRDRTILREETSFAGESTMTMADLKAHQRERRRIFEFELSGRPYSELESLIGEEAKAPTLVKKPITSKQHNK